MKKMKDCVFCRIVRGEEAAHIICEDGLSTAILDVNPLSLGHCLVIPKRHVAWWHGMTEEEVCSAFSLCKKVSEKLMKTFRPDFIAMYVRGRRIPHTHIFLVPTFKRDPLDRFFHALEGLQESPPSLMALRKPSSMARITRLLRKA